MTIEHVGRMQKQAEAYLSLDKPLKAIAIYEQIISQEPNFAPAHSELARVLESQGWLELAIPHYAQALTLAPNSYSLDSHLNFGKLLHSRGNIDGAISSYQRAININPQYIRAYQTWAETLIQSQRLDEVLTLYAQAELYDLDLIGAKDYSDLGIAYINQGKVIEAITCFQKSISIQPSYASAHCNLGNALLQQNNYKEALISFYEALSIDPEFAEVYFNLGITLTKINRHDEAIACFEAALSLNPEFKEAYSNLGFMTTQAPNLSINSNAS
ncbi:tetratricopeptide repeat protein [Synechococcus sp. PCC 7502]|uniref:tetratricopeptide repeat protein n=1 Tax=Synechococcus sp. PCC 7502 TaxID=1173263 RepID=UPI00029F9C0D|nr:tetratricopeptide repeat protein [Synechococcus sp. PCC 7502]AFY72611.1 tetratricopeptide repeat protein [Synechococcus sp. PCC 7502]